MVTSKPIRHETGIQWCHVPGYIGATWNPTTGCTRVSPGCDNCYAFTLHDQRYKVNLDAAREHPPISLRDLTHGPDLIGAKRREDASALPLPKQYDLPFSTVQMLDGDRLTEPLRTKRPHAYFVDSMADLFHDDVTDEYLDRVFAVMALAPQHIFMILTKRPERMRAYLSASRIEVGTYWKAWREDKVLWAAQTLAERNALPKGQAYPWSDEFPDWPLANVWLGISAEDQARYVERWAALEQTPAAVKFISYEPALGPLDVEWHGLDWLIVGGESGPRARAFDVAWARSVVEQGRAAGVPVFVKQLGARPFFTVPDIESGDPIFDLHLKHSHGSNPDEWPEDLRVRQFPAGHGEVL